MPDRATDLRSLETLLSTAPGTTPSVAALLAHFGGVRGLLLARRAELAATGLDPERISRLTATRRLWRAMVRPSRSRRLLSPHLVAGALPHLACHPVEEVWVLPVDAGLRLLSRVLVARGGAASCAVCPDEILGPALRMRARGVFVVHNHPSGDPTPSPSDIVFTDRLVSAAKPLGVRVEDHLVIAGDRWASVLTRRRGATRFALQAGPPSLKTQRHGHPPLVATEGGDRDLGERGLDARLKGGVAARVGADRDLDEPAGAHCEADLGASK